MLTQDEWGKVPPLAYALLGGASVDNIIAIPLTHTESDGGSLPFDFGRMIVKILQVENV